MTPRTTKIVCARAPRHIVYVPAVRGIERPTPNSAQRFVWRCSFCGARVKVVA